MSDHAAPSLDAVLAHGGWLLIDPRPVAAAHPDTFEMPTPEELELEREMEYLVEPDEAFGTRDEVLE